MRSSAKPTTRCIDATGKMKLSYMNKILEGWHLKGISTLEAAQAEQQAVRDRNRKKGATARRDPMISMHLSRWI